MDSIIKDNFTRIFCKMKNDVVFTIALAMALLTSFLRTPKLGNINFKVIILLFNLMVVVKAFEKLKIMDKIAIGLIYRFKNFRRVSLVLIGITFFSSMLVTNDVALLTFVPLTLIISKKANVDFMETIIFETLAANIGSSITPMGNPQNLFLFTHYKLTALEFFKVMCPFIVIGIIWLILLNFRIPKDELKFKLDFIEVKDKKRLMIYTVLFFIIILSVFDLIDYRVAFAITVISISLFDRELIKNVDYLLLLTFICFFIFIGNLSAIEELQAFIKVLLHNKVYTYIYSIAFSQVISNVPCAILVAGFTDNWREVLLGVNIGGMGTLIASLASVISYKLYVNEASGKKRTTYLLKFTLYNFISLLVFAVINYMIFLNP